MSSYTLKYLRYGDICEQISDDLPWLVSMAQNLFDEGEGIPSEIIDQRGEPVWEWDELI